MELFRWDDDLWAASRNNPVLMLSTEDQKLLEAAASDEDFLAHLKRVANDFEAYRASEAT